MNRRIIIIAIIVILFLVGISGAILFFNANPDSSVDPLPENITVRNITTVTVLSEDQKNAIRTDGNSYLTITGELIDSIVVSSLESDFSFDASGTVSKIVEPGRYLVVVRSSDLSLGAYTQEVLVEAGRSVTVEAVYPVLEDQDGDAQEEVEGGLTPEQLKEYQAYRSRHTLLDELPVVEEKYEIQLPDLETDVYTVFLRPEGSFEQDEEAYTQELNDLREEARQWFVSRGVDANTLKFSFKLDE